ncbi:hypothetical protein RI367_005580 [Sorochytrium milnesiophthora]
MGSNAAQRPDSRHRWAVLVSACLLTFGVTYCYGIPTTLGNSLRDWLGSSDDDFQWQLNLMYSIYAIPSTFLPLVSGYLMDRFGTAAMLIAATLVSLLGTALMSLGVSARNFTVMAVGRLLYGVGTEPLDVVSAKVIADWFHSNGELAVAFGISTSTSAAAFVLEDNLSLRLPALLHTTTAAPVAAFWCGFAVSLLSALAGAVLLYIDRPVVRLRHGVSQPPLVSASTTLVDLTVRKSTTTLGVKDNDDDATSSITATQDGLPLSRTPTASTLSDLNTLRPVEPAQEEGQQPPEHIITVAEIRALPLSFWLLCCVAISYQDLQFRWGIDEELAASYMSICSGVSLVLSPAFGVVVDKFGYRGRHYLPMSATIVGVAHVLLNFTLLSPVPWLVAIGVSNTMHYSVLWVCVPDIVQQHQTGTAFGLLAVVTNLSLIVFPLLVARIKAASQDYVAVGMLFIGISAAAVALSVALELALTKHHPPSAADGAFDSSASLSRPGSPPVETEAASATSDNHHDQHIRHRHVKPHGLAPLDVRSATPVDQEQPSTGKSSARMSASSRRRVTSPQSAQLPPPLSISPRSPTRSPQE